MAEDCVRLVQDMYKSCMTVVRCTVGVTDGFKVEVVKDLALNPFLFAVLMHSLTDKVSQESLWSMMFADVIVMENVEVCA